MIVFVKISQFNAADLFLQIVAFSIAQSLNIIKKYIIDQFLLHITAGLQFHKH